MVAVDRVAARLLSKAHRLFHDMEARSDAFLIGLIIVSAILFVILVALMAWWQ
jgi:hypothetical protein